MAVTVQASPGDVARGDRGENRAAGFVFMAAIAELAVTEERPEFAKTLFNPLARHVPQAELPDTRGVDQRPAAVEVEQLRRGRGMGARPRKVRQVVDPQLRLGQLRVDQR